MFTHTHTAAKTASVVAGLALVLTSFATFPAFARAQSVSDLQTQINALLAQIAALQGTQASITFTSDLTIGSTGAQVTALQNWLIQKGYSIPAGATGYFGVQTQSALAAYQAANGIAPAVGYFGPVTRAKVNATATTPTTPTNPGTSDELRGGAGSIDSYDLISGLRNEEVGERSGDVEVAGLEIEVDNGSDIRLTALRIAFDEGTATSDFDDYASEVSVWLDGEEIARVDADDFTDRNDWTRTVTLDRNAVIQRGDTGELVIAVSGARNIDSAELGDTWTVDFRQIRFVDADNASISEDPNTAPVQFSFESFATASDTELRVSDGDEDINDSRVIDIDDSNRTRNVPVLSFNMEVRGDSDVTLESLPVEFTVTGGAAFLDDMVSSVQLYVDGKRVASENVPVDENTIVFDNIDLKLEAGDEYEFEVRVDFNSLAGAMNEGDTIAAAIGETETDSNDFKAEDESGEDLADNDVSGSADSGPHALYDSGIMITFVSSDESVTSAASNPGDADQGTFKITFEATAFGNDVRLDRSCVESQVNVAGQGVEYSITNSGSNTTECLLTSSSSDSEDTASTFEIDEGRSRTFTLTVVATATAGAFAQVQLDSVNWGSATDDTNDKYYDFNLDEFKTGVVFLRAL